MSLAPLARLGWSLAAWTLLFLASPGILDGDGSAVLSVLGLALWGLAVSRPGPKALWIEWLAASIGLSAICWWSTYVVWITLLAVALVPALYLAIGGALLRALAARVPLTLALPAAWVALESLRTWVEPPLGFGWLRLGHHASHLPWLAGSARVWGVVGLSWVLAAVAGALAELLSRSPVMTRLAGPATAPGQAPRGWIARVLALGPSVLAPVVSLATSAPATEPGPRLLLVQPAFEQRRKMNPDAEAWSELLDLTKAGVAGAPAREGRAPIDLVCWGESMVSVFEFALASEDLLAAWDRGLRPPPWVEKSRSAWESMQRDEQSLVRDVLYGKRILPAEACFLSGAELFLPHGDELRRASAAVLWGPGGQRLGWGTKVHLVPGGETMAGLERWGWVRRAAHELAGYIPDLVAGERAGVVELPVRGGRPVRLGLSICFDNAFDDPYTDPLRRGPVDAHVILSNEAWYVESSEYDHMLAFSRLVAISTGRPMVRVTNSGVTTLFGADGVELARLRVGGKDRMVPGTLLVDLPVPVDPARSTPFVHLEKWLRALAILLPLALLVLCRRRPVTPYP